MLASHEARQLSGASGLNPLGRILGLSDDRAAMIESLKRIVVPGLRQSGFKGSYPHFRRPLKNRIDLLTFQFDKYGGGFVVEIAKAPPGDFDTGWGEIVPVDKLHVAHLSPMDRFRLGSRTPTGDYWFRYDRGKLFRGKPTFDELADRVSVHFHDQGEKWWNAA